MSGAGSFSGKHTRHEKSKTEKGEMPIKSMLMTCEQMGLDPAQDLLRNSGSHLSELPLGRWNKPGHLSTDSNPRTVPRGLTYPTFPGCACVQPSMCTWYQERPRQRNQVGTSPQASELRVGRRSREALAASAPAVAQLPAQCV